MKQLAIVIALVGSSLGSAQLGPNIVWKRSAPLKRAKVIVNVLSVVHPYRATAKEKAMRGHQAQDHLHAELVISRKGKPDQVVPFGLYEGAGFDVVIGDRLRPPFVVRRRGAPWVAHDLILPGYKWHPQTYWSLYDVRADGVLGSRDTASLSRAEPFTGKIIWQRRFGVGVRGARRTPRGVVVQISPPSRTLLLAWNDGQTLKRLPSPSPR
ncbi:MAG TPA: hypothetical protein VEX38_02585 [Fimbriimonadaceae bacterium]|nr:hypothetical protein [Fimbriimonadaceae bacterium]